MSELVSPQLSRRMRRRKVLALAATGSALALAGAAHAQAPARGVVTLVVPQAPGGAVDFLARAYAEYMTQTRGIAAIVVNKPGAAGEIAATFVAAAPPDGTTLLVGNSSTMVVNPQVRKTRYDPEKDFRLLGGVAVADTILLANKTLGLRTLQDLIRYAKENPGKLAYASNGVGGAFHLAMEYLQHLTGTRMLHVPYSGAAQAEMALVANEVAAAVLNTGPTMARIRSGSLVPLAVVGSRPSIDLPDLVLASRVVPNFAADTWVGVFAPAGLPDAKAVELNAMLEHFAVDPKGESFLRSRGFIPVPADLAAAADWMRGEKRNWGAIVAEARKNGPLE